MTARARRRLNHTLTGLATITFPKARRSDAHVVRDCAREAVDATSMRALPRESLSLAMAGMRTRIGLAATEFRHAPWRDALAVLALPLAATLLLVWTFGFISRYDHWPLGEGWAMLLGGSLLAVIGAALERRWLTVAGAIAVFVAAASPYVGFGTEVAIADTPSFFQGWSVDIGVASLLPTLLLVAAGLSLRRSPARPASAVHARLAAGLGPALVAAVYLFPGPAREPTVTMSYFSPGEKPRISLGRALSDALDYGIAAALADPGPRSGRRGRPDVEKGSHAPRAGSGQRARAAERGVPADLGRDPHRRAADSPVPGLQRRLPAAPRRGADAARPLPHAPSGTG